MDFFSSCKQVTSFLPIRSFTCKKEMLNEKFHFFYLVKSSLDTLDDRELRRITYKIAEGDWKSLVSELDISTHDATKIQKDTSNNQEVVYRLLVTWRGKVKLTRAELIKELCDHVNSKQKDVIRFLREMGGLTVREPSGVKSSFKKLRLSLKSK